MLQTAGIDLSFFSLHRGTGDAANSTVEIFLFLTLCIVMNFPIHIDTLQPHN